VAGSQFDPAHFTSAATLTSKNESDWSVQMKLVLSLFDIQQTRR